MRTVYNLDFGWRFHRGDLDEQKVNSHTASYQSSKSGAATGGAAKEYADADWRLLDLPHDYIAESEMGPDHLHSGGYRERGNAWYRKVFTLDEELKGKALTVCFEGTATAATFYFNGSLMARTHSAYTETTFDITDRAYFDGRPNVLAVYINGFESEGWWYEGAGIYRHVKLYATDKLHIAHNGIFAKPVLKKGTKNSWFVDLTTTLENREYEDDAACVRATLFDGDAVIAQSISPLTVVAGLTAVDAKQKLAVSRPTRWDVDNPKLYDLQVEVVKGDAIIDSDTVRIGFRTFYMDPDKGFFLNDRPLKIKGVCCHQDHAGVGVAVPDTVQYYRIQRLKDLGCNAYRASHNLPAKEVLDACDELGLIVMDENRRFESRDEVLDFVRIMVKRDCNHPSVIFYSLFNEEPLQNVEEGARIFRHMKKTVEQLDDSRLITGAINASFISHEGAGAYMDVIGVNYSIPNIAKIHTDHPNRPIIGSENNSAITTRGCYTSDKENAQVLSQYDGEEVVPWGQSIKATWDFTRKNDYFAGIFIWTGFDYRGEPTPFKWPSVSSQFGIMDTCGFAKESFYYNKACFTTKPMVHLMPHWNWTAGETVRVVAITNCDEAELFVNGVSLGRKAADVCNQPMWEVPFQKGRIEAKAYRNGKCVARDVQRTVGKPRAIKIDTYRDYVTDDGQDVVIVNCSVVDSRGREVPTATNHLHFEIEGDGVLLGVGNGDPNSHELDCIPERNLFAGHCQAIIRALPHAKTLKIRVMGDKLETAEFAPAIIPVKAAPFIDSIGNFYIGGITQSDVTEQRPDPLVVLNDDNQNSFTPPTGVGTEGYPTDFKSGWRIFRALPTVTPSDIDRTFCLEFDAVRFKTAEIYVNGERIFESAEATNNKPLICPFTVKAGVERLELRILMQVETSVYAKGFKNYAVSLKEAE